MVGLVLGGLCLVGVSTLTPPRASLGAGVGARLPRRLLWCCFCGAIGLLFARGFAAGRAWLLGPLLSLLVVVVAPAGRRCSPFGPLSLVGVFLGPLRWLCSWLGVEVEHGCELRSVLRLAVDSASGGLFPPCVSAAAVAEGCWSAWAASPLAWRGVSGGDQSPH